MDEPNQPGPTEEEVAGLLAALPPVPRGWTEAALAEVGVEPQPAAIAALRARLM
jgi:hypothetical protein